jgi:hypothetical protein
MSDLKTKTRGGCKQGLSTVAGSDLLIGVAP